MSTKYAWIGASALLVTFNGCAAPDEVDDETLQAAHSFSDGKAPASGNQGGSNQPVPQIGPSNASPVPKPSTPSAPSTPDAPSGGADPSGAAGSEGMGGADAQGGAMSMGGAEPGAAGSGGMTPAAPGAPPMIPVPEGEPPASMDWETCDPAWATHFCPELDCETTELCTRGGAEHEENCNWWCTANIECAANNKECIVEDDPLCIMGYFPRNKCIDYIDPMHPKSAGMNGGQNWDGSYGSIAAKALLQCACGGGAP